MKKQQSGFTLIELVMVIVILGILAAFALPKFADLSGEAEIAVCKGGLGATKSGAGIAHAAWLAAGGAGATVSLENVNYAVSTEGYPTVATIEAIAGLSGFTLTPSTTVSTLITADGGTNTFTYTAATGVSVVTTGCI